MTVPIEMMRIKVQVTAPLSFIKAKTTYFLGWRRMVRKQTNKTKNNNLDNNKTKRQKPPKNASSLRGRQLFLGVFLIVLGLFTIFAYISFSAGVLGDGISFAFKYLFGATTLFVCAYLVVLGIFLALNKIDGLKVSFLLAIILLVNIMIGFTINAPNLMDYSLIELFSWAKYGQHGGIIGILLTRALIWLFEVKGTILLITLISAATLVIIFRNVLKNYWYKLKEWQKTQDPLKEKIKKKIEEKKEQQKIKEEAEATRNRTSETTFIPAISDHNDDTHLFKALDDLEDETVEKDKQKGLFEPLAELSPKEKKKDQDPFGFDQEIARKTAQPAQISSFMDPIPIDASGKEPSKPSDLINALNEESYVHPSLDLLNPLLAKKKSKKNDVLKKAKIIEKTLENFGVKAKIIEVNVGPSISRFELELDAGVKVSKFVNLSNDLALALASSDIRIEAPIPGKAAVGIEVPNAVSEIVGLREIIESPAFKKAESPLTFGLGKTLSGEGIIGDIAKMPHVLIAGATGSGKSVCINSIIISLLYKSSPDDLRFIMIDPKMVELNQYNDIPHLLIPVVTDPKKAAYALNWGLKEMTDRYMLFKEAGVRDIDGYNEVVKNAGGKKLPRIVIVIDELADLMISSPKECENAICRIAQLARACGIHLIIATQRPSVDVITGLIKANIPSRIAFAVTSNVDSRTILDSGGAEKLLGKGDMLYFPVGQSKPTRAQCTYVSDGEINRVIEAIKPEKQVFDEEIEEAIDKEPEQKIAKKSGDVLTEEAMALGFEYNQISTSMLQRKLQVGYARAGRIVDELEDRGLISGPNGSKPRQILVNEDDYQNKPS